MNVPQCIYCRHLDQDAAEWVCKAYPNGIPQQILEGEANHVQPYPGDNGIQFEPIDEPQQSAEAKP